MQESYSPKPNVLPVDNPAPGSDALVMLPGADDDSHPLSIVLEATQKADRLDGGQQILVGTIIEILNGLRELLQQLAQEGLEQDQRDQLIADFQTGWVTAQGLINSLKDANTREGVYESMAPLAADPSAQATADALTPVALQEQLNGIQLPETV